MPQQVKRDKQGKETYVGERPKCYCCGREMRPVYDTEYDLVRVTRPMRVTDLHLYHSPYWGGDRDLKAELTDPQSVECDSVIDSKWDADKGRWMVEGRMERKITKRVFTGRFRGVYGTSRRPYFCTERCAGRFAELVINAAASRASKNKSNWERVLDAVEGKTG